MMSDEMRPSGRMCLNLEEYYNGVGESCWNGGVYRKS